MRAGAGQSPIFRFMLRPFVICLGFDSGLVQYFFRTVAPRYFAVA
jgi:hypothetical protein